MLSWEITETKLQTACCYLIFSLKKKKTNKDLELIYLPHYLYNFWRNFFYPVIFYSLTKFHCLVSFTSYELKRAYMNSNEPK